MSTVAFLPVKDISERVPGKNRLVFDGDLLFLRKLRQLIDTPGIDTVYLDTESDEIAALGDHLPVRRLKRPPELASNATDGHELFAWEASQVPDADIYVQALCTAPFVDADTIGRALTTLRDSDADSLVAARFRKDYLWADGAPSYGGGRIPNSVDLLPSISEGMSLYMVRRAAGNPPPARRFGQTPVLFPLNAREDIDINTSDDLALALAVAAGERAALAQELASLRSFISTPLVSDVCRELGHDAALPQAIRQLSGRRMIGTAKTMSLRAIRNDDDPGAWRDIFRTLEIYQYIQQGDVILVGTDIPEKAFFGDLNASLALRAGAVGAVVDGVTRDIGTVRELGLSMFARSSYYDDIRYHGALDAIGRNVVIGERTIAPGDIVIGDEDGVAFVPKPLWPVVKQALVAAVRREAMVRVAVLDGMPATDILTSIGDF